MSESLHGFVARSTRFAMRTLVQNCHDTSVQASEQVSTPAVTESAELDVSSAERLETGTFIFPKSGGGDAVDWCVLSFSILDTVRGGGIFRFRGRLRAGTEPVEFINKSYEYVLMRRADGVGRDLYTGHIINRHLSHRDVLKALAKSDEAAQHSVKFIIVPEPSSWLSALGVKPGDDAAFPSLFVKM